MISLKFYAIVDNGTPTHLAAAVSDIENSRAHFAH